MAKTSTQCPQMGCFQSVLYPNPDHTKFSAPLSHERKSHCLESGSQILDAGPTKDGNTFLRRVIVTDLEVGGDALQRHGAAVRDHLLLRVQVAREGEAQRDRREEHLDADEEVLVAGGDGSRLLRHVAFLRVERADDARVLQDRQQQPCVRRPGWFQRFIVRCDDHVASDSMKTATSQEERMGGAQINPQHSPQQENI